MAESASFLDLLLGAQIQSDGTRITPRRWLNFDSSFTLTEDETNDRIMVSGGGGGGGFTAGGDLAGSSTDQDVIGLSGLANIIALHGTSIIGDNFTTNGGTAPSTVIQAANATGSGSTTGSTLDLKSGTGNTAGALNLRIGSTIRLNITAAGMINLSAYATPGVMAIGAAGAVDIVSGGADGLLLSNNATPAPVWSSFAKLTTAGLRVGSTVTATAKLDVSGDAKIGVNTAKIYLDSFGAFGATTSAVWLGAITPLTTNEAVAGDGTSTTLNSLTRVQVAASSTVHSVFTSSGLRIGSTADPTERLEVIGNIKIATDSAAKIFQQDNTTNNAIAAALTIQGPNATGTTSSGGPVVVTGGTGTSSHSGVNLQHGGSTKLQVLSTGAAITGDGTATGDLLANSGATGKARLGSLVGTATRGALYLGNVTASGSNAVLNSDGSELILQAPGANPIYFRSNNSGNNLGRWDSAGLRVGDHSGPSAKLDVAGNCILGTTTSAHQVVGSQRWTVRTLAAGLVIDTTTTDMIILVDTSAARAITLPAATAGRVVIIKDKTGTAGTNNITITRAGSESIEGIAANYTMATNWGCITLVCDGTNWFVC